MRIRRHVHGQTRPGEMPCRVKADIVLYHRRLCPFRQFQVVAVVRSVDLIAFQPLRNVHQQQRLRGPLVALNADVRHALRQAFRQMQENLRLNRCGQRLTFVVDRNVETAVCSAVAKLRAELAVNKHQTHSVDIQRQCVALFLSNLGKTADKLATDQPFQRRVFPVFMLTRRQPQAQHLL